MNLYQIKKKFFLGGGGIGVVAGVGGLGSVKFFSSESKSQIIFLGGDGGLVGRRLE